MDIFNSSIIGSTIVGEVIKKIKEKTKNALLRKEIEAVYHSVFTKHERNLLPLCSDAEFSEQLFFPTVSKSIDGLALVDLAERVAAKIGMGKSRLELISILKFFVLDCKNHFANKAVELGRQPVAYQDLYFSLEQQAITEARVNRLIAEKKECQEHADACQLEIKALRAALVALPETKDPGVPEALRLIDQDNPEAAEAIFRKMKERKRKEGREALKEAAAAARHLGALAFSHDTKTALAEYREATELDPDNAGGWNNLGRLLTRVGELDAAVAAYVRVEQLGRDSDDAIFLAKAYGNLGVVCQIRGDLDQAVAMHEKSLALYEQLGSSAGMAIQFGNLGIVYGIRGDLDLAVEMFEEGLALDEQLGNKDGMATAYGNLGSVHKIRDDLDKAVVMFEKSLTLHKELGSREGMAAAYGSLGNVYRVRGDLDKAVAMYDKSLTFDEQMGDKQGMARSCGNLGNVYQVRGELDRAIEMYEKSLALNEQLGSKVGMAYQYGNLGIVYEKHGDLGLAEKMWQKSLVLFTELGAMREIEWIAGYLRELRNG